MTVTNLETSTQYVVFSGRETVSDVDRIIGKLTSSAPVTFSFRHTTVVNTLFFDLLVSELRAYGVREIASIFAEPQVAERIREVANREQITYTAK